MPIEERNEKKKEEKGKKERGREWEGIERGGREGRGKGKEEGRREKERERTRGSGGSGRSRGRISSNGRSLFRGVGFCFFIFWLIRERGRRRRTSWRSRDGDSSKLSIS